jgi:hypothetical protein
MTGNPEVSWNRVEMSVLPTNRIFLARLDIMPHPDLRVLGVYRPNIDAKTWRKQWRVTGNDDLTRAHFERLVLIEAEVECLTAPLNMAKFGQMQPEGPTYPGGPTYPCHMQCGYGEGLLSSDGESLIQRKMNCIHGTGRLRFSVYLHYYDPSRPLLWEFGEVICPPAQPTPARLMRLLPYAACT